MRPSPLIPDVASLLRATRKKEAERRQTLSSTACLAASAHPAQGALACRRSTAALARGTAGPQGSAPGHVFRDQSGTLDPMDRQPGRRSCASPRVLPAPSCHHPVSTSRTGHCAGRVMPDAARVQKRRNPCPRVPRSRSRQPFVTRLTPLHEERDRMALFVVSEFVKYCRIIKDNTLNFRRFF